MNNRANNGDIFHNMMLTLGSNIAQQAIEHAAEAEANWEQIKNVVHLAKQHGKEQDALTALFEPGEGMPQRKDAWYRKTKRVLKLAVEMNIDFSKLSLRETEKALVALRTKSRTKKDAEADALRMLQRTFKGAMARSGQDKVLASIQQVVGPTKVAKAKATRKTATAKH